MLQQGIQAIRCPAGLYFDIEKQTCDWKDAVKNCKLKNKERKVKPLLYTEEPLCQDGYLACGDSTCIERGLFCNGEKDCADGSDENSCGKQTFYIFIYYIPLVSDLWYYNRCYTTYVPITSKNLLNLYQYYVNQNLISYVDELERILWIKTGLWGVTNNPPVMPITWPKKTSQCYVETRWQMGCLFYLSFIEHVGILIFIDEIVVYYNLYR